MNVKVERVGDLILTTKDNAGEKFYNLEDILEQAGKFPCALDKVQTPIKLDCHIIFGYRYDAPDFIQSVFVDEKGLHQLINP